MQQPVWITTQMLVAIHNRQLAEHGGTAGVRDESLLDKVLVRPQQQFDVNDLSPSVPAWASNYAFAIAKNNAFIDGNKRTATVVCEAFLALNGYTLTTTDVEMYPYFLGLAAGDVSEEEFAQWLGEHSTKA